MTASENEIFCAIAREKTMGSPMFKMCGFTWARLTDYRLCYDCVTHSRLWGFPRYADGGYARLR